MEYTRGPTVVSRSGWRPVTIRGYGMKHTLTRVKFELVPFIQAVKFASCQLSDLKPSWYWCLAKNSSPLWFVKMKRMTIANKKEGIELRCCWAATRTPSSSRPVSSMALIMWHNCTQPMPLRYYLGSEEHPQLRAQTSQSQTQGQIPLWGFYWILMRLSQILTRNRSGTFFLLSGFANSRISGPQRYQRSILHVTGNVNENKWLDARESPVLQRRCSGTLDVHRHLIYKA